MKALFSGAGGGNEVVPLDFHDFRNYKRGENGR